MVGLVNHSVSFLVSSQINTLWVCVAKTLCTLNALPAPFRNASVVSGDMQQLFFADDFRQSVGELGQLGAAFAFQRCRLIDLAFPNASSIPCSTKKILIEKRQERRGNLRVEWARGDAAIEFCAPFANSVAEFELRGRNGGPAHTQPATSFTNRPDPRWSFIVLDFSGSSRGPPVEFFRAGT